jgi:hypothetical protein
MKIIMNNVRVQFIPSQHSHWFSFLDEFIALRMVRTPDPALYILINIEIRCTRHSFLLIFQPETLKHRSSLELGSNPRTGILVFLPGMFWRQQLPGEFPPCRST